MSFEISSFTNALNHQGARASLFEVTMTGQVTTTAAAASTGTSAVKQINAPSDIKFACRATTIPGMTITPIPVLYFGREVKTPGELEFADWTVTVINDNNMRTRRFIEAWMNHINSHSTNMMSDQMFAGSTSGEYSWTGDAQIQQYSKNGNLTSKYNMTQCWPTALDPIDMNYDNVGTIQEYGITFSYNYWTSDHSKGPV